MSDKTFSATAVASRLSDKSIIAGAIQNAIASAMDKAGNWREQKILIETSRVGNVIVFDVRARRIA